MLSLLLPVLSQYDPYKINKRAVSLFDRSMEMARDENYVGAIKLLQDALRIEPKYEDALLSIAGIYGELKKYDSAILYYEKAKGIDAEYFRDYNLPFSINFAGKGDFSKAILAIDDFLAIPNLNQQSVKAATYRKQSYQFAIDYAKEKPLGEYKFEPRNLGDSVNSEYSEYYPTITLDGKELVFTRRIKMNEDFYSASKSDISWSKASPLKGNINSGYSEGAQNISQDGQWLIFTGCLFPDGLGSCDLYISLHDKDGWSKPENLGYTINGESWESAPSLSPDKRDLYFASNKPGGYGGSDIYVSRLLPNGRYSEPENLGPEVNTAGQESCPFIHADNQTLYFTSNGHLGYGGDDLFMVKKLGKTKWNKPVNLGYPINTVEDEGSLIVAADGLTAYYASNRSDSYGGLDLYTFELRSDIRPSKTVWVKGKVFDKKTQKGLPSTVELADLGAKETVGKVQTDEAGNYLITLPVGKDYAFNVNRRGYLFYSENFPMDRNNADSVFNIDIALQPLEANATIVLKNIFFETKVFELKTESTTELDKVVQLLKDNPTLKIEISGHTDNIGKPEDNLKLSENRAQSVVKYLASKGIKIERLIAKGYGAVQPLATNNTEEGRSQNRRTELKVLSQ